MLYIVIFNKIAGSNMTYGLDLRERVVSFVSGGGSKAAASRDFKVSLWCVHNWCSRENISAKPHPNRVSKIDMKKLSRDLQDRPDAILRERAIEFGVTEQAIWHGLKRLKATHKKNDAL
jgi:transposase